MSGHEIDYGSLLSSSNHVVNESELNLGSLFQTSFLENAQSVNDDPVSVSDADSAYNTNDFSPACLKFISDVLLEEELEDKPCMIQDSLALQAAEKSFSDVLNNVNSVQPESNQVINPSYDQNYYNPDENINLSSSVDSCASAGHQLADSNLNSDQVESFLAQPFYKYIPEGTSLEQAFGGLNGTTATANSSVSHGGFANSLLMTPSWTPEIKTSVAPYMDMSSYASSSYVPTPSRGRKYVQLENDGYIEEERRSKHSLACTEECEQLEIFDKSFLHRVGKKEFVPCPLYDETRHKASKKLQQNGQQGSSMLFKRMVNRGEKVDLWTLLTDCAQSVGSGDQRIAIARLKQIRQHTSPFGNAHERMAHYFANGLEARLNGGGKIAFTPAAGHTTTAAEILRAYQLYVSVAPFRKMTNTIANRSIAHAAEKATSLHIIDFGISYGFQWPCFINRLSTRPGGAPKIRITGIDLPQPGFRPAERVEETGRRLKRVADALNVPFEYNAIAQRWDTIQYEDLKINSDEFIAVNCMYRLRNLPDDTIAPNSPRDAVLKLIKQINPDIFMHGILNGSFNAPFFVTRFREALFHYSALFDMFEANVASEDQERMVFEREMIGRDAINVIACEGLERFERPETYKQWQARNSRIGFRQIPIQHDVLKRTKRIKSDYHKDFVVDTSGNWLLLGWKGRVIHAISAWKPVQNYRR